MIADQNFPRPYHAFIYCDADTYKLYCADYAVEQASVDSAGTPKAIHFDRIGFLQYGKVSALPPAQRRSLSTFPFRLLYRVRTIIPSELLVPLEIVSRIHT